MRTIILLILLSLPILTFAQRGAHTDAIEISVGCTRFGENKLTSSYGNIGFGTYKVGYLCYFKPKWYFQAAAWHSREVFNGETASSTATLNSNLLHHNVIGSDFYVGYSILGGPDAKFNINILGGATMSLENGAWKNIEDQDTDSFNKSKVGGVIGAEVEYYFTPRWSLLLHANEHFVGTSSDVEWGYKRWYVMAGLRYHFHWNWPAKKSSCNPAPGKEAAATPQQ